MSITVGGASHQAAFARVGAVARPESAEAKGAPDHDGDDVATKATQTSSRSLDRHA
jgi:hypothetical protein